MIAASRHVDLLTLAGHLLDLGRECRLERINGRAVLTTGPHTVIHDGRNYFIVEELTPGADWHYVSPSALEVAETIHHFDD